MPFLMSEGFPVFFHLRAKQANESSRDPEAKGLIYCRKLEEIREAMG
jgi:hypothetical protein